MIYVITSYFNPAGYRSKEQNFLHFRTRVRQLKLPLICVEWSQSKNFSINKVFPSETIIHVSSKSVMWLKECLLNIALNRLPDDCDGVIWSDNDIVFMENELARNIQAALDQFEVIQPFERIARLPKGIVRLMGGTPVQFSFGYKASKYGDEIVKENEEVAGNVGYAWAARRDFLERCGGLYDGAILDGGDRLMAHAFAGCPSQTFLADRLNCFQHNHFMKWAANAKAKIGFAEGTALHLWHGSISDRRYTSRHETFRHFGFNPARDIKKGASEVYEWSTEKPEMHRMVRDYFVWRAEDE